MRGFVVVAVLLALDVCFAADSQVQVDSKVRAPPSVQYEDTSQEPIQEPVVAAKRPQYSGVKGRRPPSTTTTTTTTPAPTTTSPPQKEIEYNSQYQQEEIVQLSEEERQEQIRRTDEDLNRYLREALENMKPKLRSGMEESDYEILDPLQLEDLSQKPLVGDQEFDVRMSKLSLGGISDYDITQLESQLSESRFKLGLYYPKLVANCLFDANGTIYDIFKVTGKGNATLIFKEVHARTVIYLSKANGTLEATSADQPYVDFSSAEIWFRDDSIKGGEPIKADSVALQLGPLYFWVLTANAVEKVDYPLALYLNNALRQFPLPPALQRMALRQRYLRIHVPSNPIPYAYVSPEFVPKSK